jgi:tRNA(adenine34) deaminase
MRTPARVITTGHEYFLREALKEAVKAEKAGEVPIGAVIVYDGRIISRGHNKNITLNDPTAHAEIVALRRAAKKIDNYRLNNCILYVTIEPCAMCAGAMIWARIKEVVYGAPDTKAGACCSVINIANAPHFNHRIQITGGILESECRALMQNFFRKKRRK